MNGWILSAGDPAPELKRAVSEAAANNVALELVDPKEVDLVIDSDVTALYLRGKAVALPNFAIAAFVEEPDSFNIAFLQHLETLGTLCLNNAQTLLNTGDKIRTHQLLAAADIPCPRTALVHSRMRADDVLRHFDLPLVLKVPRGSKGNGVLLVKTRGELENILECQQANGAGTELIAQKYVEHSHGRDVRVLVIDRQPVAAMLREGPGESFKSNFSQGGSVSAWELTDDLRALSKQVIDTIGLNIGGIDFFVEGGDFQVCEANSMPGFQGIEQCCDINVPQALFRSIVRQLAVKKKSRFQMRAFLDHGPGGSSVCDRLAATKGGDTLNFFLGLCAETARTQEAVLLDILRRNATSDAGRRHGFERIANVEQFRERMPLTEWADYAADAQRMEQGEKNVMFAGESPYFIATSGTSGAAKFIPESEAAALAKSITGRLRIAALLRQHPTIFEGFFLPLSNAPSVDVTSGGIPVGSASGLTLTAVPAALQKRMAFPIEVLSIQDQDSLDWVMMLFALEKDVRAVIGNNAARAEQLFVMAQREAASLIEAIASGKLKGSLSLDETARAKISAALQPNPERARELQDLVDNERFTPRFFWPNLSVFGCWLAGSVGRFTATIRDFLPSRCALFDCGYGASEGKFNVPLEPANPAGPLALHAAFYEFEPLDGGVPLLAHELADNTSYGLIITSYSGLHRYHMNDIVRVDGFTGSTPNIFFETKSGEVANIVGEKLSPPVVIRAFESLPDPLRVRIKYFALLEGGEEKHHWLCVEPYENEVLDQDDVGKLFEKNLYEGSLVYRTFRDQELIEPCRAMVMQPGWQESLYAARTRPGKTTAQIKLPVIMREQPEEAFVGTAVTNG